MVSNQNYNQNKYFNGTLNIGDSAYNNISSSNMSSNFAGGARISNRSVTLNLTKGKYLVFGSAGYTGVNHGNAGSNSVSDFTPDLSYSNGTCTKLDAKFYEAYSSETLADFNIRSINRDILYKCSFTSSTTLTYTNSTINSNTNAEEIRLYAIKLT